MDELATAFLAEKILKKKLKCLEKSKGDNSNSLFGKSMGKYFYVSEAVLQPVNNIVKYDHEASNYFN